MKPGTAYQRRRRAGIAAGTWQRLTDPGPARTRVLALRSAGLSVEAIAELAGLPTSTVAPLAAATYTRGRISVITSDAIVTARLDPARLDPARLVPAIGTRRRLQALAALGWPGRVLAAEVGVTAEALGQWRVRPHVTANTALIVRTLYDRHKDTPGPSACSRKRSLRMGWAPPPAWPGTSIDDPAAAPQLDAAPTPQQPAAWAQMPWRARRAWLKRHGLERGQVPA